PYFTTSTGGVLDMASKNLTGSQLTVTNGIVQNVQNYNAAATISLNNATFFINKDFTKGLTVDFVSGVDQFIVDGKNSPSGKNATMRGSSFSGFATGDQIVFYNIGPALEGTGPTYNTGSGKLTFTLNGINYSLNASTADGLNDTFQFVTYGGYVAVQDTAIPCFVTGARILTARGEVPVEGLRVGDQAMALLAGGLRRIRWIGHRRLDLRTHPKPETVHPISVSAGAFADGSPHRDLWLSPGHFVFVDGVLIQISKLVNGATIVQVPRHEVTYWHVELDQHDVLLAEGLQVESYLDTGNRNAFANAESFVELHPDFMPKHWTETCAPLAMSGPQITAVQARLLRRATEELGYAITYDCDLHLVVDGQIVSACEAEIGQYRFGLPAGA